MCSWHWYMGLILCFHRGNVDEAHEKHLHCHSFLQDIYVLSSQYFEVFFIKHVTTLLPNFVFKTPIPNFLISRCLSCYQIARFVWIKNNLQSQFLGPPSTMLFKKLLDEVLNNVKNHQLKQKIKFPKFFHFVYFHLNPNYLRSSIILLLAAVVWNRLFWLSWQQWIFEDDFVAFPFNGILLLVILKEMRFNQVKFHSKNCVKNIYDLTEVESVLQTVFFLQSALKHQKFWN